MANRSYLYAVDFDSDKQLAVIGDFYKGREKLFVFLDKLAETNLLDNHELELQINETKAYLCDANNEAPYIMLECGEIFEMAHEDIEGENKNLFENEILKIDKIMEDFILKIQNMPIDPKDEKYEIDRLLFFGAALLSAGLFLLIGNTKVGANRGEVFFTICMLVGVFPMFLISMIGERAEISLAVISLIQIGVAAIVFVISYCVSCKIYAKSDF